MTLTELRKWAADDFIAATHQTMGQYRTALLRAIDDVIASNAAPALVQVPTDERVHYVLRQYIDVSAAAASNIAHDLRLEANAAPASGHVSDEQILAAWDLAWGEITPPIGIRKVVVHTVRAILTKAKEGDRG